jgi:hypothetical protein
MHAKITADHLERTALVYVRQSTPGQVRGHLESQRRQYALADVARELGFHRVETIDDDLGISGSGFAERPGFQRLLTTVSSGAAGAVLALEASRLARNDRRRVSTASESFRTGFGSAETMTAARITTPRIRCSTKCRPERLSRVHCSQPQSRFGHAAPNMAIIAISGVHLAKHEHRRPAEPPDSIPQGSPRGRRDHRSRPSAPYREDHSIYRGGGPGCRGPRRIRPHAQRNGQAFGVILEDAPAECPAGVRDCGSKR